MPRTEDHPCECRAGERARVISGLEQRRQPLLAQPFELRRAERRTQRHIRHQRQRIVHLRHRSGEANRGGIETASGTERCAEEVDRIREIERVAGARALVQHRRREAREPVLAGRICRCAGLDDQRHVCHRHFVHFDNPHRQSVRERALLDRRQLQRRNGAGRRWLGTVRRLLRCNDGRQRNRQEKSRPHFPPSFGTTDNSIRLSGTSHRLTAARMSFGCSDM